MNAIRFEENEYGDLVKAFFSPDNSTENVKVVTFEKGFPSCKDSAFINEYKKYLENKLLFFSNEIDAMNREAKKLKEAEAKIEEHINRI